MQKNDEKLKLLDQERNLKGAHNTQDVILERQHF